MKSMRKTSSDTAAVRRPNRSFDRFISVSASITHQVWMRRPGLSTEAIHTLCNYGPQRSARRTGTLRERATSAGGSPVCQRGESNMPNDTGFV